MVQPTWIQYASTPRDCSFGLDIFLSFWNFRFISNENLIQMSTGMVAVLSKCPHITGERLGEQDAGMSGTSQDSASCLLTVASPNGHERQSSKTPHLIMQSQRENPEVLSDSSGSGQVSTWYPSLLLIPLESVSSTDQLQLGRWCDKQRWWKLKINFWLLSLIYFD